METTIYICGTEVTLTLLRRWKSDTAVEFKGMRWHYRIKAQFENKEIIYTFHGSQRDFDNRRDMDENGLIESFYIHLGDALAYCQNPIEQEFFNCFGYNYYEAKSRKIGKNAFNGCKAAYNALGFSEDKLCEWTNYLATTYDF